MQASDCGGGNGQVRVFLSAFSGPGHVFPVLALARTLSERGHDVWFETIERWRQPAEEMGLHFVAAPEYIALRQPLPGMPSSPTLAEIVESLLPLMQELRPDVVVNDFFYVPAALAAELEGLRRATVVPHPYPVNEAGLPYFLVSLLPPRTALGAAGWRLTRPWFARRAREARRELNFARREVGLPLQRRLYGGISDGLGMVATFPQLEYPRRWPSHVHVTGPMLFELPHASIELPEDDRPLVLVAGSTAQDQELRLIRTAIRAFEGEPVRALVSLNQQGRTWPDRVPENVTVVDWVSYSQVLPRASVVLTNGGHGTVVRSLSEGVPLVVCPAGGDMGENGARVAWTGAGLMLPRALLGPAPLRWAIRRVLADAGFAERARSIAAWGQRNKGPARGAELLERYAKRS
jgi:UDP:flavonoid glycosyltransferase YjiC (YdhE family)